MTNAAQHGPLTGLRILEVGHFVAAPFCTRILGDLGADIIKIEPPGGDPVRQWGELVDGNSLWWSIHGRNKRSITLNLKSRKATDILIELVKKCDALIENFRPGQLAKMGLGDDVLRRAKPDLVIAHISGFGQDGPYRDRAAFGVIGEAMGGLRHLTDQEPGMSDLAPVRVGLSIGDSIAGLYAAFGVMASLWQRDRVGGDGRGRNLDVALTESVLSLTEGMLPEYAALGKVRQPTGSRIPTAAPSSAYRSSDGKWMLIAANSEPLFRRLAHVIGRPDMLQNAKFEGNQKRVENVRELDEIISAWTNNLSIDELERRLTDADIPSTRVYSVAECAADPQFRHRRMVRNVEDGLLGPVLHLGIVPHVSDNPGTIRWTGPSVGQHTDEVLGEFLHMTPGQIQDLRAEGII